MSRVSDLLKLVQENPDLPIVPMVDGDICGGDDGRWMAEVGYSAVKEYAIDEWYGDGRIVYRDEDEEELIESIAEGKYEGTDEDYKRAEEEAKSMWSKAIIVNIDAI